MRRYGGNIEERGQSFRIRIMIDGVRHTFTLSKKDFTRRTAEQWATKKHRELEKEHREGPDTSIRMSAVIRRFKEERVSRLKKSSQKPYDALFAGLADYFVTKQGDPKIANIRTRDIREYLEWRRRHPGASHLQELSSRTVDKERANFRTLLEWAFEMEWIDANPAARIKPIKGRAPDIVVITDIQYEALLRVAATEDPVIYTYILLLGETGIRCESEALWLRWQDVKFRGDDDAPHIEIVSGRDAAESGEIHTTKAGKSRSVPMSERLAFRLRQHFGEYRGRTYANGPSPWVFHHRESRRSVQAGTRIASLRTSFEKIATTARMPAGFTMHDLRHRRCTLWLAEGIPIYSVKEAMGHSSVQVTEWYTHFTKQHLQHFGKSP